MIKSMTGYGRAQRVIGTRDITAEIKSVNHRFFEFTTRTPRACGYLEEKLKGYLQGQISRGKVEVSVQIQTVGGEPTDVQINQELAQAYVSSLRKLGKTLNLRDDLTLTSISRFTELFSVRRAPEDEEAVWEAVQQVVEEAARRFVAMRSAEGDRLCADLLDRLADIERLMGQVRELAPRTLSAYRERLTAKLQEVLADRQLDESRILTEAAIFADRIAVDEETVRLASHIAQFREILAHPEPVGRKLDFLVQEMNREANTVGSKAQDLQIAQIVVEIKSDIEKIREQIQNIE